MNDEKIPTPEELGINPESLSGICAGMLAIEYNLRDRENEEFMDWVIQTLTEAVGLKQAIAFLNEYGRHGFPNTQYYKEKIEPKLSKKSSN